MVDITTVQNNAVDADVLAQTIFGSGVSIQGATYTGDTRSAGIYENADTEIAPAESGVILSTGRATSFYNNSGSNPNIRTNTSTNTSGVNNDAAFNAVAGATTFDAAFLDVDFIPSGNVLNMQFVFASEEYPEYTNSIYNDAVGVWVNGSPVPLSVGDGSTSVGNVNQVNNINLYNDNTGDAFATEMDGFTVTLSLTIPVVAGALTSIRIGIADVGDSSYDSNLLIAANSLQTDLQAVDDDVRLDPNTSKTVNPLANDTGLAGATLVVTHINGQEVTANTTINLPNGQSVLLNNDGTFTITADADVEVTPFSYSISDGTSSATAFVNVSTLPCFIGGTFIRTPEGDRRVEQIKVGDLVATKDHGPQPVRWVGHRRVAAIGEHAPIRVAAHTFAVHQTLMVSPQHRILVRDPAAELLFGDIEVFIPAKHLVNGRTVVQVIGGEVDYFHLLLDAHQVIFSNGLPTESLLPGPQSTEIFEAAQKAEIADAIPGLNPETGAGYSPAARRILKQHEALVLLSQARPPELYRLDREVRAA